MKELEELLLRKTHVTFIFCFIIVLIVGCSVKGDYSYPEDLPEKGGLSVIIIHPDHEKMEKPEFLSNYVNHDVFKIIQVDFKIIEEVYPLLKIDQAPYYLFLDYKGIVFETTAIEEANLFYHDNVNAKTD